MFTPINKEGDAPPPTKARTPLPNLPERPAIRYQQPYKRRPLAQNRERAKRVAKKGESLNDDSLGVDADFRCKVCESHFRRWLKKPEPRPPQPRCRVARDPEAFNSYRCGACIGPGKKCSFSMLLPGVDYEVQS
ncbi:hypothetical protein F4825DRAFT_457814 [Nemania diffusa]|nr:hypothetical protein F4825DRAFT_457814 [Nemania diffusa]